MPLPLTTLGYETARHVGVGLVKSLMEDARTTGRWYLGVTMGRPTGHLTLGIGKAASATCTIIPEEFPEGTISLAEIVDIVEGSIVKRPPMGKAHGWSCCRKPWGALQPARVAELQESTAGPGQIRHEIDSGLKVKNEVQMRPPRGIKGTSWTRPRLRAACAATPRRRIRRDLG